MRLSEALSEFEADVRLAGSPRTAEIYAYAVRRLIRAVGDAELREASERDLRRFLAGMKIAPAARRLHVIALRGFFAFGVRMGWREDNPARPWRRQAAARAEDVRRLLAACEDSPRGCRNAAVAAMLFESGLRASELCALRLGDVVLSERKGKLIVRGKGEKAREVPLNAEAREALQEWLAARPAAPEDRLFIGRRGPLTASGVWRIVAEYARKAGLEDVHPHVLRHTFATRLLREAGADLVTVAELLGHESLNTTARYTRPSEKDLRAAVERLG